MGKRKVCNGWFLEKLRVCNLWGARTENALSRDLPHSTALNAVVVFVASMQITLCFVFRREAIELQWRLYDLHDGLVLL